MRSLPLRRLVLLPALLAVSPAIEPGYVAPQACRPCHSDIFDTYMRTGMGRSFYRIESAPIVEDWTATYRHPASKRKYAVLRRDGAFHMQRSLPGEPDAIERQVHYVMGSGNHSRTYLHRKANGKLVELPLSWYAEGGGSWAMSPGYDRPDHSDFRREVPDSCLFCHNGYPSQANGGLAEGIDCQRCHGPGEAHLRRTGPIVNPARLSPERSMEICMQCHLESASRTIPDSIRRYDRTPFSYRPGQPLGDFTIYFDRAAEDSGEAFTVNHSAYGLRRSKCFVASAGQLTCTTCHNPHRAPRGEEADRQYTRACRGCHAAVHLDRAGGCAGCHMPKRRTDDAVHVVMTDHRIRRTLAQSDLLAAKQERHGRYLGPVKLSYPATLPDTAETRLYLAVASLTDRKKLKDAVSRLAAAIDAAPPEQAEFFVQLADASREAGRNDQAMLHYRRALERDPRHIGAATSLATLLLEKQKAKEAVTVLEIVLRKAPDDVSLLNSLAVAYGFQSRFADALQLLRRALALDPEVPLTWLNLGVSLQAQGDNQRAAEAYRTALRLQPDFDRARSYLNLLRP